MSRLVFAALLALAVSPPAGAQAVSHEAFARAQPPGMLSEYGLFADAARQHPADGITPYSLITSLYSDYTEKFRFIYLPPGSQIHYRSEGRLLFPVGSALIKTFAYPLSGSVPTAAQPTADRRWRLLETRLLVRRPEGWEARVYIWNAEQTDARYKVAGKTIYIDWLQVGAHATDPAPVGARADSLRYRVPNLNQCASCHSSHGTMVPLGPKARNLDRVLDYGLSAMDWGRQNQLQAWQKAGLLTGLPTQPTHDRVAAWDDLRAPLDKRARAYLDMNCGHCHQPAGVGSTSGLYLHWEEVRPVHLGIGKRPVAAGRGSGGFQFDLVPGRPEISILLYRMRSSDPAIRMPEISVALPHAEGIELIRQWIAALDSP